MNSQVTKLVQSSVNESTVSPKACLVTRDSPAVSTGAGFMCFYFIFAKFSSYFFGDEIW